ncbi:MAG: hypothetical protein CL878_11725 [Dehalococcoidia bacterium]|nr:hypothetical protein [Dehalococcoidia bacterium]
MGIGDTPQRLGDLLVAGGIITEPQRWEVLAWQRGQVERQLYCRFGEATQLLGLASMAEIDVALASQQRQGRQLQAAHDEPLYSTYR